METLIIIIMPKNLHQSKKGTARVRKINKICPNVDGVDRPHTDIGSVTIQKDAVVKNGTVMNVKTVISLNTLKPLPVTQKKAEQ